MHYFNRLITILFLLFLNAAAVAEECWICDDEIELTKPYASCFMSNYDLLLRSYKDEGLDRRQINLAGCNNQETVSQRGGLLKMGVLPDGENLNVKSVYTLSKQAAICLHGLLKKLDGEINPSVVFDLSLVCNDG